MSVDKSELHSKIEHAFADVSYPGDDCIGHPDARPREREQVTQWLKGRDWRSLKAHELWAPSLDLMTTQAFRYYLPAFLLASNEEDCGDVMDGVMSILTPDHMKPYYPPETQTDDQFEMLYKHLTPAQKEAIRDFLDYQLDDLMAYH